MTLDFKRIARNRTLDALMQGDDLTGQPDACRGFLAAVLDQSSHETAIIALPLARRLLTNPRWPQVAVSTVIDFARKWQPACEVLRSCRTDEIDPESEMMAHLAMLLIAEHTATPMSDAWRTLESILHGRA